jgi:hypothetical protein
LFCNETLHSIYEGGGFVKGMSGFLDNIPYRLKYPLGNNCPYFGLRPVRMLGTEDLFPDTGESKLLILKLFEIAMLFDILSIEEKIGLISGVLVVG